MAVFVKLLCGFFVVRYNILDITTQRCFNGSFIFFIYLIDVKGKEKIFTPFKALGMNPLFAFVMAGLFSKILGRMVKWTSVVTLDDGTVKEKTWSVLSWFYNNVCVGVVGESNELSSLIFALVYVAVFTAMAMFLYKKKIVIKL